MHHSTTRTFALIVLPFALIASLIWARSASAGGPTTRISKTESIHVEVPGDWKANPPPPNAKITKIFMFSADDDYGLRVLAEPKIDLEDDMTIDRYGDMVAKNLTDSMKKGSMKDARSFTVNGRKARQTIIIGVINDTKILYERTAVEGQDYYYTVDLWMAPSRYEDAKPMLEKILQSFAVTTAAKK